MFILSKMEKLGEHKKKKQYIIVMWNPNNENMNKYRDNRIEIGYYYSV